MLALTFMVAYILTVGISRIIRWVVIKLWPGDRMLAAIAAFAGTVILLFVVYWKMYTDNRMPLRIEPIYPVALLITSILHFVLDIVWAHSAEDDETPEAEAN